MRERALPSCVACGEVISAGKGWVRDPEGQPVHLRCTTQLPCLFCSKPILPKAGIEREGRWVHRHCHTQELKLQAMVQRDRTGQGIARSRGLIERTRAAIARAQKARPYLCAACGQPLKGGSGLLFQGKDLVHATCWRAQGPDPESPAPPPSG